MAGAVSGVAGSVSGAAAGSGGSVGSATAGGSAGSPSGGLAGSAGGSSSAFAAGAPLAGAPLSLAGQWIVPVVVIDDASCARDLAEALVAGGIGCGEFTLRTPAALAALEAAAGVPGFVAGVGTVVTPGQLAAAVGAGARFAVTPGFDDEVVADAQARGLDIVPGVATPTELGRALRAGLDHVKVFPAGVLGGTAYLDALAGPFPTARFLPSGGVSQANAREYLEHPSVFAVSGGWVVPRDAIAAGDFERIAGLARAAAADVAAALAAVRS